MFVKRRAFVEQVVRADDGGIAAGVAAAEPTTLKHGDVGDAVLLCEIVGGREAMPAAADDQYVVFGLWFGRAPLRAPAGMPAERPSDQSHGREFLHRDRFRLDAPRWSHRLCLGEHGTAAAVERKRHFSF